jgi:hypothetical protein
VADHQTTKYGAFVVDLNREIDPSRIEIDTSYVKAWWSYHGLLADVEDIDATNQNPMRTRIYGFETVTNPAATAGEVPTGGAVFGYVIVGAVDIDDPQSGGEPVRLRTGQWFARPDGASLRLAPETRVVATQRVGFRGLGACGGPIETAGRLRYIDRCSDTVLMPPPVMGDPCLNHLHFPLGIEQTEHTHPSTRAGAIARGFGWCETPAGLSELWPGAVFYIPADGRHRFVTGTESMDVIAYHPDSDWGPTDEEHPMINRTWVDGRKLDNTTAVHHAADVIGR